MQLIFPIYKFYERYFGNFEPNGKIILIWDFFYMMLLMFSVFFKPINIGFFYFDEEETKFKIVYDYTIYFYILDIFIRMNTGIYNKGIIVYKKSEILGKYFRNQFFLDLITIIPTLINKLLFQF